MKRIGLLALWLISPSAFAQACQNLVNCSFEIPSLSSGGYQYNPSAPGIGWAFSSNSGIQTNGSAWHAPNAPDGKQTAFIQSIGTVSQAVSLNAGSYTLSFQAAQRAWGCCTAPYINPIMVTVDGTQIASPITPASTSVFNAVSIAFSVASGGTHTLKFAGTSNQDATSFIDVVSITPNLAATATTLVSSLNPSTVGTSVTFTATVVGSAPTGSVAFTDAGSAISGCAAVALTGGGNAPSANCSTSSLAAGTHNIVAAYGGDSANAGSTSATLSQVVNSTPPPPNSTVFITSESTAAPNDVVPVDALVAGNASSNVDIAIVPKGTGAILAQVPDGTLAGGDKRGQFATDFQRAHTYTSDVASGYGATISGGVNSAASGMYATVVGGYGNDASGHVAIVGGQTSTASGEGSPVALGYNANATGDSGVALGHDPVASGTDSVAIGRQNVATRDNSIAIGWDNLSDATQSMALGTQSTTRSIHGALAIAGGQIATRGDAQRGIYILKAITSGGAPTQLTTDASPPSLSRQNVLALPDHASYAFTGRVIARDLVTGDSVSWKFEGNAKRATGAGTVTQVSTITQVYGDSGASTWTFNVVADTADGSLALIGTGQLNKTVQWVATVDTVENVGGSN